MGMSPLQIFLGSACITGCYVVILCNCDFLWKEVGQRYYTAEELCQWLLLQLLCFWASQLGTTLWVHQLRGPMTEAEKKANQRMMPYVVFNHLVTIPAFFAINLFLQYKMCPHRRYELYAPFYVLSIECVHHTMHSAMHVPGWWGWRLHQHHHLKDFSLPVSAVSNHPVDFGLTIIGVVAGTQVIANREPYLTCLEYMVIGHIGTLVHADMHWLWFMDFHGMHHADGRCNINSYIPFSDFVLGTFKKATPYPRKVGWR